MSDKDNVRVCCRFRPLSKNEDGAFSTMEMTPTQVTVDLSGTSRERNVSQTLGLPASKEQPAKAVFSFDRVFAPECSNAEVYQYCALPMCKEIMQGFNCTIFAYGQTGSGKTHTMMGEIGTDREGIIPRLCASIFDSIEESDEQIEFTVKLSYVEIYMERIKDLLDPEKDNLRIREGSRGVWIQDCTERYVSSVDEILEVIHVGSQQRATASTLMNEASSRSHSVFILTLGQRNKLSGSKIGAKLVLVDLAGSETVRKTGASGNTLKEAQHINKSLSALGNVINSLTTANPHVPYRDSKLTRLLSDSLGGNSKTCLIITASPSSMNLEESLSTLRFGSRAKKIRNKPIVNQEKSVAEYKVLLQAAIDKCTEQEELIARLQKEIAQLKAFIREKGFGDFIANLKEPDTPALSTASTTDDDATSTDSKESGAELRHARSQSQVMKNLELQSRLAFLETESKNKEDMVAELQEALADKERDFDALQQQLDRRDAKINELQRELADSTSLSNGQGATTTPVDSSELELMKKKLEEFDAIKQKLEWAEGEKESLVKRVDELQRDNIEMSQLKEMHLSSISALENNALDKSKAGDSAMHKQEAKITSLEQSLTSLKTNYDVLMSALGRKCEQYIELQLHLRAVQEKLEHAERKLLLSDKNSDEKMQEKLDHMQKRLVESDKLCQKLFHSGLYWQKRGHRKERDLAAAKARLEELHSLVQDRLPDVWQAMEDKWETESTSSENSTTSSSRPPSMRDFNDSLLTPLRDDTRSPVLDRSPPIDQGHLQTPPLPAPSSVRPRGRSRAFTAAKIVVPVQIQGGQKGRGVPAPEKPIDRINSMDHFF